MNEVASTISDVKEVKEEDRLRRSNAIREDTRTTFKSYWKYFILPKGKKKLQYASKSREAFEEFKRLKYWSECEQVLEFSVEINNILPILNELLILRQIFYKEYHLRLSPRIGLFYLRQARLLSSPSKQTSEEVYRQVQSSLSGREGSKLGEGGSLLQQTKDLVTSQLLVRYKRYREAEILDFSIITGIKNMIAENERFQGDIPTCKNEFELEDPEEYKCEDFQDNKREGKNLPNSVSITPMATPSNLAKEEFDPINKVEQQPLKIDAEKATPNIKLKSKMKQMKQGVKLPNKKVMNPAPLEQRSDVRVMKMNNL